MTFKLNEPLATNQLTVPGCACIYRMTQISVYSCLFCVYVYMFAMCVCIFVFAGTGKSGGVL